MIYEVNEEELFYLISEKNEDAELIFYNRIESYLQFLSRTYTSVYLRQDDILSYGWQGVIEALACYNPMAGVSFSSFVRNCIQRRIIDVRRRHNLDKHKALMTKADLADEQEYQLLLESSYNTEVRTVHHLYAEVMTVLERQLTPREWWIFRNYLDCDSTQTTAEVLDISTQTIYRVVNKAKLIVKRYLDAQ